MTETVAGTGVFVTCMVCGERFELGALTVTLATMGNDFLRRTGQKPLGRSEIAPCDRCKPTWREERRQAGVRAEELWQAERRAQERQERSEAVHGGYTRDDRDLD